MSKVLITGSAGFIGGYVVQELLDRGHHVVGVDNHSKYGPVSRSYDEHPNYTFVEGDARDVDLLTKLASDCDHLIAGAAMIGGISYFHAYAYDLLATNERIMAASCDAAIKAHRTGRLQKVTYLSSSMVFESTEHWPSKEGDERRIPPPLSSYGFQKLAVEYYAKAAWDQYKLPYTIVRPFNCVGVGEGRALGEAEVLSGNVKLAMSHVVPDLVQKVLKGQDPALDKGLLLVSTDEAAHADFFRKMVELYLEEDRAATLEQMRRVFNSFKMPAVHMFFDGRQRVEAIKSMRIFDEEIFISEVYEPLIQRLGVHKNELRRKKMFKTT